MKKNLTVLLLLFCSSLSAQNDSLRKAVENYRGRSNILLPNARQMMIDKLDSGKMQDVKQLYQFLMTELVYSDQQLFYNNERLLLSYYVQDYQPLLRYLAGGKSFVDGGQLFTESHSTWSGYAPYLNDQLRRVLYQRTSREFYRLSAIVQNSPGLQPDDAAVLQLYLRFLLPAENGPAFKNDSVEYYTEKFFQTSPRSVYTNFVKNVIYKQVRTTHTSVGMGLLAGGSFLNGPLTGRISNQFNMGADLYWSHKKLFANLQFRAGGGRLQQDVNVNNTVWKRNDDATGISLALMGGYALVNNRSLLILPQAGIGYTMFTPSEEDINQNPALKGAQITTKSIYPVASLLVARKKVVPAASDAAPEDFWFTGLRLQYEMHRYPLFDGAHGGVFSTAISFGLRMRTKNDTRGYYW